MMRSFWHIFQSEMCLYLRQPQDWLQPICFYSIIVMLYPLALTPDPIILRQYFASFVWISVLLSSLLSSESFFQADREDGYLEQLVLSSIPLVLAVYAKLLACWLVRQLPLILLTPFLALLFTIDFNTIGLLELSLVFGTPVFVLVGCLGTSLTIGLRQQGVLLALLMTPILIPILIFAISAVEQMQHGLSVSGLLLALAGTTVLAITLIPWAIAALLKISLD